MWERTVTIRASRTFWLEKSEIVPMEEPRSYYVEISENHTVLIGEDWLEPV